MDKITVNGVPLKLSLEADWMSQAGLEFQVSSRKYWHNKSKVRVKVKPHGRNGKVRHLEDWEIFVHEMDKAGRDIADMSVAQLRREWKVWIKERKGR